MTPALLLPAALATLLAVIIPLAIHIARKSEQLPTDFAALRWLRQKPKPRSRLRFDERLLLALRLLLIALLALWLARPVIFGAASNAPYVAVIPGADPTGIADGHWLAPGFPALDEPRPPTSAPASLIRQLDAELPAGTPLTIIAPPILQGADAERPRLSRKITWRIASPFPGAGRGPVQTVGLDPGLRRGTAPIQLSIRHDAAHRANLRYLRAVALAWQAPLDIATTDASLPATSRPLIWLVTGTLPTALTQWVERGGTALVASDALFPDRPARAVLWRDDQGQPLGETIPLGKGRLIRLTRPLVPSDMPMLLDASFPAQLRALFAPPAPPPTRTAAAHYAPLTGGPAYDQPPQDLRPWLAALIALLFLAERWIATRRSRAISP